MGAVVVAVMGTVRDCGLWTAVEGAARARIYRNRSGVAQSRGAYPGGRPARRGRQFRDADRLD
jgi:hypothetical protein